MADRQTQPGYYSGQHKIPKISDVIDQLDRGKKDRDAAIDEEQKVKSAQAHKRKYMSRTMQGASLTVSTQQIPREQTSVKSMIQSLGRRLPSKTQQRLCTSMSQIHSCPYRMPILERILYVIYPILSPVSYF
jgi:predicted acyl esterase